MKRTLLCAVAAAALVTACGQSTDPIAQSTTSTAPAALWDSCTLSDDVLIDAGLLPATKNENQLFDGWRMCSWRGEGEWYGFGVYASTEDVNSHFKNDLMSDFRPITVGSRRGWTYHRDSGITPQDRCALVLPARFGAIDFSTYKYSPKDRPNADMCQVLIAHVVGLMPSLPE